MPYSVPDGEQHPPVDAAPVPAPRHHRRSSSNSRFSNEKYGPGAFAPISNLPRRKSSTPPSRPMFQFPHDSDDTDDDDPEPSTHTPRLTLDTHSVRPTPAGSIPFPTSGPASPRPRSVSPLPSPLPRTPSSSTPILLANGKPLRPSLKSSNSSPHLPPAARATPHLRSQSAPSSPNESDPSTPAPHKNVHFKEDGGLETVRVFNKAGKPASISKLKEEETETETEGYDSSSGPARFPFPSIPSSPAPPDPPALVLAPPPLTSVVPCLPPPAKALPPPHILVSSLALTPGALRGTLLVLNIAYEKRVAVRFTLDDWCTTSEVGAAWDGGGVLPPAWARRCVSAAVGSAPSYDTFTFSISLHDLYLSGTLPARVLFLAAKYTVPGAGEWWDNNRGENYRVGFQLAGVGVGRPGVGRSVSEGAGVPTLGSLRAMRPRVKAEWERERERERPRVQAEWEKPKVQEWEKPKAQATTAVDAESITRGTGFSRFELPFARGKEGGSAGTGMGMTPPTSPYSTTRLTLRNYASPGVGGLWGGGEGGSAEKEKDGEKGEGEKEKGEKGEKEKDPTRTKATSPLPTPPASRSSSMSDMPIVGGYPASPSPAPNFAAVLSEKDSLVGGHPATPPLAKDPHAPPPKDAHPAPPAKDSYAALLARWCFHTGEAEKAARWESLGMA